MTLCVGGVDLPPSSFIYKITFISSFPQKNLQRVNNPQNLQRSFFSSAILFLPSLSPACYIWE